MSEDRIQSLAQVLIRDGYLSNEPYALLAAIRLIAYADAVGDQHPARHAGISGRTSN